MPFNLEVDLDPVDRTRVNLGGFATEVAGFSILHSIPVYHLVITDEIWEKISAKAAEEGMLPEAYFDMVVAEANALRSPTPT